MLKICAIASGSNGNCYYIGNHHEAILIDAGISARRIISRMSKKLLDPSRVKAIFISHEHADHAMGAGVLSRKLRVPVFLTSRTYSGLYPNHKPMSPRFFEPGREISLGSFRIHPFLKKHDASEPCSFRIEHNGIHVGVFTDIGCACENVMHHLEMCNAVFLETNYDVTMLSEGSYPPALKQRISSDHGHLSNDQAFDLLKGHCSQKLEVVFLSHLSAENNTPEKALDRFSELAARFKILLTSRHAAADVFQIGKIAQQGTLNFEF